MPSVTSDPADGKSELEQLFRVNLGEYVSAIEAERGGRLCLVGLGDGRVVGLEPRSGEQLFSVAAHSGGLLGLSVSPDGKHFATCGHEPVAKLWTSEGVLVRELAGGGGSWVEHVAWSQAGDRIATASAKKVRVWSALGEPLVQSDPLASTVSGLAFRSDGSGLAASCYGGVHIFPFVNGAKARHLAWQGSLISLAWSPDGKIIACGSQDSSVHFWRLSSGQDSEMSGYPSKPKALAWDRDSKLLATAGDSVITLWDFRGKGPEGTEPMQLEAHISQCTRLAFSPRSSLLASGSQDTSVLIWEPRKRKLPKAYGMLDSEVTALAWDAEHNAIIGADASGNVCAWRAP
jgi:WD40 repeat protein